MTNDEIRRTLLDMLYYCWDSAKNAQPESWEKMHFQAYAEALTETMRWIGEVWKPVVTCQDCKYRLNCLISGGTETGYCKPDWFCADGEREGDE